MRKISILILFSVILMLSLSFAAAEEVTADEGVNFDDTFVASQENFNIGNYLGQVLLKIFLS